MILRDLCRFAAIVLGTQILYPVLSPAQIAAPNAAGDQVQFVVYLSRHGVRSPTGKPGRFDAYSASPWPKWNVPPGYLTAHGFELMRFFGAYDRAELAQEGLLASSGCKDAASVTILADSDERTRETGKALAEGMFPNCPPAVQALPEGTPDALFHAMHAGVGKPDAQLDLAAIKGRIGGNVSNLTAAYRPQLRELDKVLAGCGKAPATNARRTSIFDTPVEQTAGKGDHGAELHGPLTIASSMAETLLLEYTDGKKGMELGWGCIDEDKLDEIMQLHTAEVNDTERTPIVARMDASNLLGHILAALEQHATGKVAAGAPGKPGDKVLFLAGHDTNIATVAGMLDLNWILDGRSDDTPPGGALVFELWRSTDNGWSVRLYYTAQTLRQMRETTPLTLTSPPERVPLFVPGCSGPDMSCSLKSFAATVRSATDPAYVRIGRLEKPQHSSPHPGKKGL